jgi:hypothetical protein
MQGTTTGEAIFCETDNLPKEFEFVFKKRVCFVPDGVTAMTDINKTGNMCTTLRRVRVTIFAVEKQ